MNSLKWDKRFLELARHIGSWSKDPSTKVGAVLVNDQKIVVGIGYNGFAREIHDEEGRYNDRERKYKFVVHAEVNAILNAGHNARGTCLYVWPSFMLPPICHECCKLAVQVGVKRIVGYNPNISEERTFRWADSIAVSRTMCGEAGITYEGIDEGIEEGIEE